MESLNLNGVAYCNLEGCFVCNDGTVNQSMWVCIADESVNAALVNARLRASDLPPIDFRDRGPNQIIFIY